MTKRFIISIEDAELQIYGPFLSHPLSWQDEFERKAQEIRCDQDREKDFIFALELIGPDVEHHSLSLMEAPGSDDAEACSTCGVFVLPEDAYYSSPCGTYCTECMETKHAPGCNVCKKEFNLFHA